MEKEIVYLRMKKKRRVPLHATLTVNDIAFVSTSETIKSKIDQTVIYQVTDKDNEYAVIDSIKLIDLLQRLFPQIECQLIGFTETIIQVIQHKRKTWLIKLIFAWLILFIGTAMTIMNFHYDVNMLEVHQKLHFIFTNEKVAHPLWLQVPYSLGLGIGMILFLNHWFKKRINEEPSPLEVELFTYQQNIDQFIAYNENDITNEDSSG